MQIYNVPGEKFSIKLEQLDATLTRLCFVEVKEIPVPESAVLMDTFLNERKVSAKDSYFVSNRNVLNLRIGEKNILTLKPEQSFRISEN